MILFVNQFTTKTLKTRVVPIDLNSQWKPEIHTFNFKKLTPLFEKAKNNPDVQQIIAVLNEIGPQLNKLTNILSSYDQYIGSAEGKEVIIKLRNRSAIKTLDVLDSAINSSNKWSSNIYLLMGMEYAVTRKALDGNDDFSDVQSDDPQYELRESMKKRPHAILLPKHN